MMVASDQRKDTHMCQPTPCSTCGKTTWKGCGQHVDEVMRNVPAGQQCTCERPAPTGLLRGLFGR